MYTNIAPPRQHHHLACGFVSSKNARHLRLSLPPSAELCGLRLCVVSSLRLLLSACSKLRAHDMQADKDRRNHSSYDSENETERGSEGQMTPIRQEESACLPLLFFCRCTLPMLPPFSPRPPPRAKSIRCYCEMNSPEGQTRARSPTDRPSSFAFRRRRRERIVCPVCVRVRFRPGNPDMASKL